MSTTRTLDITATSTHSFEDAIRLGLARAQRRGRSMRSAWVRDQQVDLAPGHAPTFRVSLHVSYGDD